jgi:hypothetical protein
LAPRETVKAALVKGSAWLGVPRRSGQLKLDEQRRPVAVRGLPGDAIGRLHNAAHGSAAGWHTMLGAWVASDAAMQSACCDANVAEAQSLSFIEEGEQGGAEILGSRRHDTALQRRSERLLTPPNVEVHRPAPRV